MRDATTSRIMRTLIVCAAIQLVPTQAEPQPQVPGDPPDILLDVEIDTATGRFAAEAVLEAPEGDVILPMAGWLSVDAVAFAEPGARPDTPSGADIIEAAAHRNRDLRVTVSGRLPPRTQGLGPVAWSEEATHLLGPSWLPTDASSTRDHFVSVMLPADQRVAATGRIESEHVENDMRRVDVAFTGRSADLGLFIGSYEVDETTHRDIRLRTYFEAADDELSSRYFTALAEYLDRYESEIGAYPYGGFSVVSAPVPVGLGFAGLTYVGRDILSHPYMLGRSLAHEVLHSWWGNAVSVDYGSGNWAEGLTTFQADYALAEEQGAAAAREMRVAWIRDLDRLTGADIRPLSAFRAASHAGRQSEGYGKAALVFHMLRNRIGREAFAAGIRTFYDENRNAIAAWSDLEAAFERASGSELGWFFEQWVNRAGLPRIEILRASVRDGPDGMQEVALTLRQDAPYYRLRVPVDIATADTVERHFIDVTRAVTTMRVSVPGRPLAIRLDPDFDIARRPLEGELAPILASLADASRINAVAATGMDGLQRQVETVLAGFFGDSEWVWIEDRQAAQEGTPLLIAGRPQDVAALRPDRFGPMPEVAGRGATRFWVERDEDGETWAFLSLERPEDLATNLRALRYYSAESFVAFENGSAVASGVWPVSPAATEFRLDQGTRQDATR